MENQENTSVETQEVAEPVINEQASETTEQTVNADGGEITTPQVDEKQVQSKEENANYANIRREYEAKIATESQKAIDAEYSRLYGESHNIHSKADYDNAIQAQEEQEKEQAIREEYEAKGVPEELLEELIQSKKDRAERIAEKEANAKAEYTNKQYSEFATSYPDVKGEDISQDVWNAFNDGMPLKTAYAAYQENATLKAKIAEYESKLKASEVNTNNANSSTGSLTGNGIGATGFISSDTFEANKGNQRWVMNNLSKIQESRVKW